MQGAVREIVGGQVDPGKKLRGDDQAIRTGRAGGSLCLESRAVIDIGVASKPVEHDDGDHYPWVRQYPDEAHRARARRPNASLAIFGLGGFWPEMGASAGRRSSLSILAAASFRPASQFMNLSTSRLRAHKA
jgi:hypothetical protein